MKPTKSIFAYTLLSALIGGCGDDVTVVQQGPGTGPTDPTAFAFRTEELDAYVKIDRMGGPATTTALLMPGAAGGNRRQQANLTEPDEDAQYAPEYIQTLRVFHFEFAPQLQQLTLAACGVPGSSPDTTDVNKCVAQAGPLVIPDVLRIDVRQPTAYPNGRTLEDPVVDRLLAIGLLNLTDGGARCLGAPCTVNTLANLPLNPPASNPPPLANFPYLNNQQLAPPPPATP